MEKIYVQRKVEIWVEDIYHVKEINDKTIKSAVDYELDPDTSNVLWESQIDLGPIEVYDNKRNIIYSNVRLDDE